MSESVRPARFRRRYDRRRGATLVMFVIFLIPIIAFLALAIDLGLLATARTQISDAADAAAMAGARALNGNTTNSANNNYSNVLPTAQTVVSNNAVLGGNMPTSAVSVQIGRYTYVTANQRFEGQFPGPSTDNWNMVQATVGLDVGSRLGFSKIFGFSSLTIQSTATAAHRPRDVAVILDYSGSMRFGSLVGLPYSGDRSSNNMDTNVPRFGHYSSTYSDLIGSSPSPPYDECNLTTTTSDGRAPIVTDFYTNSTGSPAFTAASSGYQTTPGGDNYLKTSKNTSSTYGQTAWSILGNSGTASNSSRDATFESSGYTAYGMTATFNGYTTGPGYWGKTFFIWPPDPRTTKDWRRLYFTNYGNSSRIDDNSKLWDNSGNWQAPDSDTYEPDYDAILNFIKNVGPNPFPSRLQSGRILYYDSIPSTIDTSSWPPSDMNQRFWKDYIDYVLGIMQTGSSSWTVLNDSNDGLAGYGYDDDWGTVKITPKSSLTGGPKPYMNYSDNPRRPRTHFWFGPLTMVDFLGNYNLWYNVSPSLSRFCWWPGTCHESPMYGCKLGVRAALTDVSNNHPNDSVALIMFSTPKESDNDTDGRFNRVRVPLGRDYASMQEALWYPPATIGNSSATVRPYDSANTEVPRAMGGTCYSYPLMLAYNQFSGNTSLKTYNPGGATGDAGGNGRKGAQKLIIFETDGAPNTLATATFTNSGAYNSYYRVRYNSTSTSSSDFPTSVNGTSDNSSSVVNQINSICSQICALDSASSPGYSTPTKKVLIHCIGFGPAFDPASSSADDNKATLDGMQQIGNVTDGMPSYKIIYGSESTIINNLQQAFTKIMQDGVQISLIQ